MYDSIDPIIDSIKQLTADIAINSGVLLHDKVYALTSGRKSPIYLFTEKVRYKNTYSDLIASFMWEVTSPFDSEFHFNAGGESRGVPFASSLSGKNGKPVVMIRKEPKPYGLGTDNPNYSVADMDHKLFAKGKSLLVDDILMYGGSAVKFINDIRNSGGDVEYFISVIDRQQGGKEAIEKTGVKVFSLTDIDTILKRSVVCGKLSSSKEDEIRLYLENDRAWHDKMGFEYPDL